MTDQINRLRQYFENSENNRDNEDDKNRDSRNIRHNPKIKKICKQIDGIAEELKLYPESGCYYDSDAETFEIIFANQIETDVLRNFLEKVEPLLRSIGRYNWVLDSSGKALRLVAYPI